MSQKNSLWKRRDSKCSRHWINKLIAPNVEGTTFHSVKSILHTGSQLRGKGFSCSQTILAISLCPRPVNILPALVPISLYICVNFCKLIGWQFWTLLLTQLIILLFFLIQISYMFSITLLHFLLLWRLSTFIRVDNRAFPGIFSFSLSQNPLLWKCHRKGGKCWCGCHQKTKDKGSKLVTTSYYTLP